MTIFEIIGWISGGLGISGWISIIALLVAGVIASRCEWVFDSTDEYINLIFFLR